jgi:hypothetical protein
VGRTSTVVEAVSEDLTVLGVDPAAIDEAADGEDPMAIGEAVEGQGGVEVDAAWEAWRQTQSVVREVWSWTRQGG